MPAPWRARHGEAAGRDLGSGRHGELDGVASHRLRGTMAWRCVGGGWRRRARRRWRTLFAVRSDSRTCVLRDYIARAVIGCEGGVTDHVTTQMASCACKRSTTRRRSPADDLTNLPRRAQLVWAWQCASNGHASVGRVGPSVVCHSSRDSDRMALLLEPPGGRPALHGAMLVEASSYEALHSACSSSGTPVGDAAGWAVQLGTLLC